jgi:hypothetical protein
VKVEYVKNKTRFKNKFAKGESRACKRGINIKHTSRNCRPYLQLEVPKLFRLLLDLKIHNSKCYTEELQES